MKWIIVTGDSGGLGSAITKVILEQGVYGVIGISRKKNDNVIFFEENFTNYKHINYDLGDIEGIKDLYKKKIKPIGQLYGLVNNSAMAYDDIVTNATADKLVAMFNINVIAYKIYH
jgi:3-oxoacyl-[acyl-carrier protein] reductase